jgi:hypothetical protein
LIQTVLIVVAASLSLLPLVAEKRQGNSIRWSVDGDRIQCEYFQLPSFSHIRSYELAKIAGVTKAADSTDPSLDVVRLQFDGLNLNVPSQSSALIWNFDPYLEGLQRFHERVQAGDTQAKYSWYHRWLIVGIASIPMAVCCWVLVFVAILQRPRRNQGPDEDQSMTSGDL